MSKLDPGTLFGLDIGAHSVKVCELSGSPGKFKIERFGVFPLAEAALIEDEIQKPSDIITGVLEAKAAAGIKSRVVILGMFGPNTMTKRLNVPDGTAEEIEDHVLFEAEQYITFGADESQIDFHVLDNGKDEVKEAFVAAAKTDVVDGYIELLKECKLEVRIVDLNVIALSNLFEEVYADDMEEYNQGTLIIDCGAQSTKIIVYRRGGPIFTKELPIGGGLITEEIQRQMGVSYVEAEDLKTSISTLPEEILNIIDAQIDAQVAEIKKNINFYISQGSTDKVNHIFVTGGSSLLPSFIEKLEVAAGVATKRLDVFSKLKLNDKRIQLNQEQLAAISPVVIGLAMRKGK